MIKKCIDYDGRPIAPNKLGDSPDRYEQFYEIDDQPVRVERYQSHRLADIKYYASIDDVRQIFESHTTTHPGVPLQITGREVIGPEGMKIERTHSFNAEGSLLEIVISRMTPNNVLQDSTYLDTHGRPVKHIRYHYDSYGEIDYEFNYHPDGSFQDGFDHRKERVFLSLDSVDFGGIEAFRVAK